jgi:hypothetical protein
MLADPRLVVPEVIEPLDQLHVAGEGERGILAHAVEGGQEDAELHSAVRHDVSSAAGILSVDARRFDEFSTDDDGLGCGRRGHQRDGRRSDAATPSCARALTAVDTPGRC